MLNNYIGGGQVFLHKLRMLRQVISTTVVVSLIAGVILAMTLTGPNSNKLDWDGAITYAKAEFALSINPAINAFAVHKKAAVVDAYSYGKLWKKQMSAKSVITSHKFNSAWNDCINAIELLGIKAGCFGLAAGLSVFIFWSRFGRSLKQDRHQDGSNIVMTEKQVRKTLTKLRKRSDFKIGKMPLVKNMETRHFLVTGATGSGKTNLIHKLLPQVIYKEQPAIIIDQTGEMISKYFDPTRGDIIFNPFDDRSYNWNFWDDCANEEEVERFSKILIGFNRKQSNAHSDPFWENSAETVFNACIEYLRSSKADVRTIYNTVCNSNIKVLRDKLKGTAASRYLSSDSKQTASSILSVLSTNARPLKYLVNREDKESFSMKEYFEGVKNGSDRWLFLATKPGSRSLTLPLIACLTELALAALMGIGIDEKRRVWLIIDEFASLGKLPALSPLMTEGRKYGACIVAGMQSLNQLYEQYGQYAGSTIFGQFGTSFFFHNSEPAIAKMISSICGQKTVIRQQKNTSFGANEFRDGVSYTEQQQREYLVDFKNLADLAVGECYVLLPEPAVRVSKLQVEESRIGAKCEGFIKGPDIITEHKRELETIIDDVSEDDEGVMNNSGLKNKSEEIVLEL